MDSILNIILGISSSLIAGILGTILGYFLKKKQSKVTIKSNTGKKINLDIFNIESSIDTIYKNIESPYIFLSYSSHDKPFAKKLADDLKENGIRVWYDEYELKIGDSLIEKIKEGIKNSAYYGVIISKSYLNSNWAKRELDVMLNQEIKHNSNKILPILIDKVQIPQYLMDKIYADFTIDYNSGLEHLIKKLKAK